MSPTVLLCSGNQDAPHVPERVVYLTLYAPGCVQWVCRVCGALLLQREPQP